MLQGPPPSAARPRTRPAPRRCIRAGDRAAQGAAPTRRSIEKQTVGAAALGGPFPAHGLPPRRCVRARDRAAQGGGPHKIKPANRTAQISAYPQEVPGLREEGGHIGPPYRVLFFSKDIPKFM